MSTQWLAFHLVARHGYAIERLKRDMAAEASRNHFLDFLAFDAASFVWAFLLASGNAVEPQERSLRRELEAEIMKVLGKHGVSHRTFVVRPELDGSSPSPTQSPHDA